MIHAPGIAFRERPGEAEEDYDFQEEENAEDEYYEYDNQAEDQLRAKPLALHAGSPPVPMVMNSRVVPVGTIPVRTR